MVLVKLPDIGEGIAEGEVVKFLVSEGDLVDKYQPLVEVMTVKVNVEIPSPVKGRVVKILAQPGQVLKVGEPFIEIESEEAVEELQPKAPAATHAAEAVRINRKTSDVIATPAVKRLAKELGVDLSTVKGSGAGGRITEEDVRRAAGGYETRIPIRGLRRMISERLVTAKSKTALVTIFEEVNAEELVKLRDEMRKLQHEKDVKLTFMPFIMKAIVEAVRQYPALNGWIDDERNEIVLSKTVNIGFAVDTPDGLLVPVLKNVEAKDVWTLAKEVEELAEKARQGRLSLDDVRGGTISISNYGALGSYSGTPIVNYPEIAIVGVGRVEKKPVVKDGQVTVGELMQLAVTIDHRAVDGGTMGGFVLALKKNLENIRQIVRGV
ncbi:MAG: dihydrolipoamide acetyltransferase family protein [Candidatus Caldarchaeum sp.]|uniref:2-oxo acid dehydrogenase subunit E2 n=1 Tax=Caldiarchaeum subterraneum TaxID=311458 RepID=A0A7C5QS48_CALS0